MMQHWRKRLTRCWCNDPQNKAQLLGILRQAQNDDVLPVDALSMIEGVLQIIDLQARDIMIPRGQVTMLQEDQTLAELLPIVVEAHHSRFPVTGHNRDEVIGILHAKDLLRFFQDQAPFNMQDVLRPATAVPESKALNLLLKEFRHKRNHMAVVVDEYGGVSGAITIEDIIEQIVGEIEDEFDIDEEAFVKIHGNDCYIIKALMPLEEFNEYFNTTLSDDPVDTIGGLLSHELGHVPNRGETITLDDLQFKILSADKRQIRLIEMKHVKASA